MSEYSGQRGSTQAKKKFVELSDRQKNRRVDNLRSCEINELLFAAAKLAKQLGESDLYHVLQLLSNDHKKSSEICRLLKINKNTSGKQ